MFRLTVLLVLGIGNGALTLKSPGLDGRIVGGHVTSISLHPWQVSLQYLNSHYCGGILIAPNWVLTTAHCITDGFNRNLTIRAGSTSQSRDGQSIAVSKIILHDDWNMTISMNNDIAVLQLEAPVTIATAKVATLPDAGAAIANGSTVTVTGWGAVREQGPSPDLLLEVEIPFIPQAQCVSIYGANMTDNMFCAGLLGVGGKSSCHGDSGGPATVNNVVVGIVSWGRGCARPDFPSVYVKISQYRDWIRQACGV